MSSLVLSLGSLFTQYFLCLLCQMIVAEERLNPTLLEKKLDNHQYYLSPQLQIYGQGTLLFNLRLSSTAFHPEFDRQ